MRYDMLFQTTPTQRLALVKLANNMRDAGVPTDLIARAETLARDDQGVFELMQLWSDATNDDDRRATIADIESLIWEAGL